MNFWEGCIISKLLELQFSCFFSLECTADENKLQLNEVAAEPPLRFTMIVETFVVRSNIYW